MWNGTGKDVACDATWYVGSGVGSSDHGVLEGPSEVGSPGFLDLEDNQVLQHLSLLSEKTHYVLVHFPILVLLGLLGRSVCSFLLRAVGHISPPGPMFTV